MLRCAPDSNCKPFKNAIGFDFFKKIENPENMRVSWPNYHVQSALHLKTEINGGKTKRNSYLLKRF